jgi:prepilin-type processing-associated H-X9-DG protein
LTALRRPLEVFICPSDLPNTLLLPPTIANPQTSYALSLGTAPCRQYLLQPPTGGVDPTWGFTAYLPCNGVFGFLYYTPTRKVGHISDGTANTIAIGETSRFIRQNEAFVNTWAQAGWFGIGDVWGSQMVGIAYAVPKINASPVPGAPPAPPCLGSCTTLSCCGDWILQPTMTTTFPGGEWAHFGFRSLHPGGAQFVYLDGSVRFVSEDIDRLTFAAMATISRGEQTDRNTQLGL